MKRLILSLLLLPLGCGGGAPALTAAAPPPPEAADAGVIAARDAERQRKRTATSNTVLTSPLGVTSQPATIGKTLLGA